VKKNKVFSKLLVFFLIFLLVNLVFGVEHGEVILDREVFLNTDTNRAYSTQDGGHYDCVVGDCRGVRHFDCSGLVYYVFQHSLGIRADLGRLTASGYYDHCSPRGDDVSRSIIGDLLFHCNGTRITHVGIVTARPSSTSFSVIHASGNRSLVVEDTRNIPNSFWNRWGDFADDINISRTYIVELARSQLGAHYLWGAEGDIPLWEEYSLTISASAGGTTDPAPATYTYPNGTQVSVTAIPSTNYAFDYWELDGAYAGTENPITITMDSDHTLKAYFTYSPPPPPPPPPPGVGGYIIPVDKFALLAPYIGLTSTILISAVITAVYFKRVKSRKEKQC